MTLNASINLTRLNRILPIYQEVARKAPSEAIAKQGSKIGFEISKRLRVFAPPAGKVRAEREAALASGEGLRIRPSVLEWAKEKTVATASDIKSRKAILYREKGKTGKVKKNARSFWQLARGREISLRERGRGYSGYVARVRRLETLGEKSGGTARLLHRGRHQQLVASATLTSRRGGAELVISYGATGTEAGEALSTPRAAAVIDTALGVVAADMEAYLARKIREVGK